MFFMDSTFEVEACAYMQYLKTMYFVCAYIIFVDAGKLITLVKSNDYNYFDNDIYQRALINQLYFFFNNLLNPNLL